jgi:DNA-binding LytR/AlgR family response regulator
VTVTPDFAPKGYEVDAHRYILKPIEGDELKNAIPPITIAGARKAI